MFNKTLKLYFITAFCMPILTAYRYTVYNNATDKSMWVISEHRQGLLSAYYISSGEKHTFKFKLRAYPKIPAILKS